MGVAMGGLDGVTASERERVEAFLDQIAKLRGGRLTEDQRKQVTAALVLTVFPKVMDGGESFTRLLMELMPGTGNVLAGIEAKRSFDAARAALKAGDTEGFLTAGGLTVLNAIGALPGVGNVLKPAIKGAKVGLFRIAVRKGETFEAFIERHEIPPSRNENTGSGNRFEEIQRRSLHVELGELLGRETWEILPRKTQQKLVGSFSNVAGPAVERYFFRRLERHVKGTDQVIREQVSFKLPPGKKQGVTKVDFGIASREEWMAGKIDDGLDDLFGAKDFEGTLFELKGANGMPEEAQKDLFGVFKDLGKTENYRFVGVPYSEVPPELMLEFAQLPGKLNAFPKNLRRQLFEGLKRRLPRDYPWWAGMDLYARLLAVAAEDWFE